MRKITDFELRQKWRNYWDECDRIQERYEKWYWEECARLSGIWRKEFKVNLKAKIPIFPPPFAKTPSFPDELMGLTCGAKTRAGTPCKLTSLYRSGRCKFHGGLSTGPITAKGKKRSAANGFKPKKIQTP